MKKLGMAMIAGLLAITCLLEFRVIERITYAMEKGRIRALRESLQGDDGIERRSWNGRAVVDLVSPAVVSIETETYAPVSIADADGGARFHDWYSMLDRLRSGESEAPDEGRPVGPPYHPPVLQQGVGSGFVVNAREGLIITNSHVVENASRIVVSLADGRRANAEVLGADPVSDLAVIRVELPDLHEIAFGDSDDMRVGDEVFVFGNPFGLDGTASKGIISAVNRRNIRVDGSVYPSMLQTDAAISPGSSGGPLVNLHGEVVGVSTAIATRTGQYDGVGFAIPSRRVREMVDELISGGPGMLGVWVGSAAHPELRSRAAAAGWTEMSGAVVTEVMPGRPAERAGMQTGDIILSVDGEPVNRTEDLISIVSDRKPGTTVHLVIWRDQQRISIAVRVGRRFAPAQSRRGS